ncbi:MAG: hypothetical protein HXY42_10835 [Chloroflexi bacterium]|nr:hypothetical protein [Chloroflexota bacterium]
MKIRLLLLLTLPFLLTQSPAIAITSPAFGAALRGEVTISGTTDVPGFVSSQLDFSYASNPTDTWFTLQTSTQPVTNTALAVWNTALVTDGDYILRLRVFLTDGTFQEVTVPLRVQNDTPIPPTPTPTVVSSSNKPDVQLPTPFLIAASPTPTSTPRPTPTPLPTNPASLSQTAIPATLGLGAMVILGLFVFTGLLLRFRRY